MQCCHLDYLACYLAIEHGSIFHWNCLILNRIEQIYKMKADKYGNKMCRKLLLEIGIL